MWMWIMNVNVNMNIKKHITYFILSIIPIIAKPKSTQASALFLAGSGGSPATQ